VTASTGASALRPPQMLRPAETPRATGEPAVKGIPDQQHPAWHEDPETLLLVEDDAGDAVLVEELLADSGMRATLTVARTLAEAKALLHSGGLPGCILLDLHLPDAQGMDLVTQVLAAAPGAPVVVLAGQSATPPSASTSSGRRPPCSSARCGRRRTRGLSGACCRPRWCAPATSR
jgi:CheY-like chemotaxis protein